jgi:large subunit ribosomal protein L13
MKDTKFLTKKDALASRNWVQVNAAGQPLGRLASVIAQRLRGKHRADFTPHVDGGDFVVVTNAKEVRMLGGRIDKKNYYRHSGYTGGLKITPAKVMREKNPERMIRLAVKGMLPRGPLGNQMIKKLKVYAGTEHPHSAQKPETLELSVKDSQ